MASRYMRKSGLAQALLKQGFWLTWSAVPTNNNQELVMEAERINQIETALEDLSTRTEELRRYL